MTFFDKMSSNRARVKIKIGMVTFSHPCVFNNGYCTAMLQPRSRREEIFGCFSSATAHCFSRFKTN